MPHKGLPVSGFRQVFDDYNHAMKPIVPLAAAAIIAAALAWVRLAPEYPAVQNIDPRSAPVSAEGGWVVRDKDGNAPIEFWPWPPDETLRRLSVVAETWPRTALMIRDGLRATWITRTRWIGFPDYTTVEAEAARGGSILLIAARQRYGRGDLGVNRTRVEAWLASLRRQADEPADVGR